MSGRSYPGAGKLRPPNILLNKSVMIMSFKKLNGVCISSHIRFNYVECINNSLSVLVKANNMCYVAQRYPIL